MENKMIRVLDEAMKLPKADRLMLAEQVLASVVYDDVPACAMISDEEIMRRADEVRSGKAKLVDGFEALDRLEKEFRERHAAKAA
jgi:hypothetical protein